MTYDIIEGNIKMRGKYEKTIWHPSYAASLEPQVTAVSPSVLDGYRQTEIELGHNFVGYYSHLLTPDQIDYITTASTLITDNANFVRLGMGWGTDIDISWPQTALNGEIITGYQPIGAPETPQSRLIHASGMEMDVGRLLVYKVLQDHLSAAPSFELIGTDTVNRVLAQSEGRDYQSLRTRILASRLFATTAIHEKIHGLQVPYLPLPLREMQAYHLTGAFMKLIKCPYTNVMFDTLNHLYSQLLRIYGSNLDLMMFGNLPDGDALLTDVKTRLTRSVLGSALPASYQWTYLRKKR